MLILIENLKIKKIHKYYHVLTLGKFPKIEFNLLRSEAAKQRFLAKTT